MTNYILDEAGNPVAEPDLMRWARWFETASRHVGSDHVGGIHISTVFLGVDHNFVAGPPVLFETMIFGGEYDQYQWRYHTRAEAVASHDQIVAAVRDGRKPPD